jgi:ABC-type uncharacterized transport system substrate-binding protein
MKPILGIRRREFMAALSAAAWPLAARAQQAGKVPIIGLLITSTPSTDLFAPLVQRLRELGWLEGRTIVIERRWAEGRSERATIISAEFVRLKVDVIVCASTPAAIAAKQATSLIPIVFAAAGNPIGSGLVASLARPGGNVTGLSQQQTDTAGKRIELLREVVPDLRRLAILVNPNNPASVSERDEAQATARTLGLQSGTFEFRSAEDIVPVFEALNGRVEAVYLCLDPILIANRVGSAPWQRRRACRQCTACGSLLKLEVSYPTQQTSQLSIGEPPSL